MKCVKSKAIIHPFTPNSVFTPGTPVFTHFTYARRRYALVMQKDKNKIKRVTKMGIKKKRYLLDINTLVFLIHKHLHKHTLSLSLSLSLSLCVCSYLYIYLAHSTLSLYNSVYFTHQISFSISHIYFISLSLSISLLLLHLLLLSLPLLTYFRLRINIFQCKITFKLLKYFFHLLNCPYTCNRCFRLR